MEEGKEGEGNEKEERKRKENYSVILEININKY